MVDENVPGIKEFFKGRDIFITGGSGKYAFLFLHIHVKVKQNTTTISLFLKVLWAKC